MTRAEPRRRRRRRSIHPTRVYILPDSRVTVAIVEYRNHFGGYITHHRMSSNTVICRPVRQDIGAVRDKSKSRVYTSYRHTSYGHASLIGVHLAGVHLAGVHLTGVHLTGVHLAGVH